MSISPIGSNSPITRLHGSTAVDSTQRLQDVNTSASDTVEISDTARYLSEIKNLPDVRTEKVQAARDSIAAGTFETPARINGTVASLAEELSNA